MTNDQLPSPFKVGDLVCLKSGSPLMTVTETPSCCSSPVAVAWFTAGHHRASRFPPEVLDGPMPATPPGWRSGEVEVIYKRLAGQPWEQEVMNLCGDLIRPRD